jgi:hypothetical protein
LVVARSIAVGTVYVVVVTYAAPAGKPRAVSAPCPFERLRKRRRSDHRRSEQHDEREFGLLYHG